MTEVTKILEQIDQGDPTRADLLLPMVYNELRKLAASKLSRENRGQSLQATALVHEAYLRLVNVDHQVSWKSRGHFFAAAAEAMRRILIEQARRRRRPKHGGDQVQIAFDDAFVMTEARAGQLLNLDAALEKLAVDAPAKAELVKLRYFGGLSHQDAAKALGISRATADRYWAYAKSFLVCEMDELGEK